MDDITLYEVVDHAQVQNSDSDFSSPLWHFTDDSVDSFSGLEFDDEEVTGSG